MKFLAVVLGNPEYDKARAENQLGWEIIPPEFTQWVIPAPHIENMFITVPRPYLGPLAGGEPCLAAEVRDGLEDPETLLGDLCKLYPGLPKALLSFYIFQVAVKLNTDLECQVGRRYRVFCNSSSARLQNTVTLDITELWTELSTEHYL